MPAFVSAGAVSRLTRIWSYSGTQFDGAAIASGRERAAARRGAAPAPSA